MINVGYASKGCDVGSVVIRALTSLTHEQAHRVTTAVQTEFSDWEVDRFEDYEGDLSVMVSLRTERAGEACYFLSGTVRGIELSRLQGDSLRQIGRFDGLELAINRLLMLLTSRSGQ